MKNYVYFDAQTLQGGKTDKDGLWANSAHHPLCKCESEEQADMLIRGLRIYKNAIRERIQRQTDIVFKQLS